MFHLRGIASAPLPGAEVFLAIYRWSDKDYFSIKTILMLF
jgi:hypothetical protein